MCCVHQLVDSAQGAHSSVLLLLGRQPHTAPTAIITTYTQLQSHPKCLKAHLFLQCHPPAHRQPSNPPHCHAPQWHSQARLISEAGGVAEVRHGVEALDKQRVMSWLALGAAPLPDNMSPPNRVSGVAVFQACRNGLMVGRGKHNNACFLDSFPGPPQHTQPSVWTRNSHAFHPIPTQLVYGVYDALFNDTLMARDPEVCAALVRDAHAHMRTNANTCTYSTAYTRPHSSARLFDAEGGREHVEGVLAWYMC